MAECAFCEDTIAGKVIRRGGRRFCSMECAGEYFLINPGEMDEADGGDGDDLEDEFDDLENYEVDQDDVRRRYRSYAFDDNDDAF